MFNHGKFNIKRFNLPSADNTEIEYRDDLTSALKALVEMGQNFHLMDQHSGQISAAVSFGALIDASVSGGDTLSTAVKLFADYGITAALSDSLSAAVKMLIYSILDAQSGTVNAAALMGAKIVASASGGEELSANAALLIECIETAQCINTVKNKTKLSIDHYIIDALQGLIKQRAALGENIYINPDMTGVIKQIAALGANFKSAEIYFDETLNSLIATAIFDTLILKVDLTIPAGGKLVIDSENYNVLLNNANAIDKHSGTWAFLSRTVDKITFRPKGANVAISMLYTERYL